MWGNGCAGRSESLPGGTRLCAHPPTQSSHFTPETSEEVFRSGGQLQPGWSPKRVGPDT